MAIYTELAGIAGETGFGDLQSKLRVAVVIKAVSILDQAVPTAPQVTWARAALTRPETVANDVLWYVIGANATATIAQILAATDSAVQANVNAAVDKIVSV